ncbi:MAG: ComEC/Rec2 family competence protein [Verrucomicrobia bacterium]|nr:ComEC/Rec2 family competence protein [Verrucomicrobiota bacterium]MDA1087519.1 ComEC/Rec2 family competence protein [Verrucomicrobiota bacterium]
MSATFTPRPLVGIALTFIAGAALAEQAVAPTPHLLTFAAFAVLVHLLVRTRRELESFQRLAPALLYLAAFATAWATAGMQARSPSARAIEIGTLPPPSRLVLIADVTGEARGTELWPGRMRWKIPTRVIAISRDRGKSWVRSRGEAGVTWYAYDKIAPPGIGERWMIAAESRAQSYIPYRGRPIDPPSIQSRAEDSLRLSNAHGLRLVRRCLAARQAASRVLTRGIERNGDVIAILHSLLLGLRQEMPRELRSLFANTGTFHIFAISGLHVGIFAGVVILALSISRVPRGYWFACLAPILIAYTISTGARPSAMRACVMAIIYFMAPLFQRRSDAVSAVSASAIALLAWNSSQVHDLGFIFSFSVVLGLIILYPICAAPLTRRVERDPFRARAESRPVQWLRSSGRYIASLLAASCAAWLTSAPLMAFYFERFAPIALPGNLVAIPLTFLIVFTGCLSLLFGSWIPLVADIFNHANLALANTLIGSIRLLSTIPGSHMKVAPIPLWSVVAWYAILLLGAFRWHARRLGARRE